MSYMHWCYFALGLFVGASLGLFVMGLLLAARDDR
jgi:uncharacterized membrane-anchored protein YhcB (DUF1043 family)